MDISDFFNSDDGEVEDEEGRNRNKHERAESLADKARGNFQPKDLISTGGGILSSGYNHPILEYLRSQEYPEYIIETSKVITILDSGGSTVKYDKNGIISKLIVTNQRVVHIASKDEDEILELEYKHISDVSYTNEGHNDNILRIVQNENSYHFYSESTVFGNYPENRKEIERFVLEKAPINSNISGQGDTSTSEDTVDVDSSTSATETDSEELRKEIDSLYSKLSTIDSLIIDVEFEQAENLLKSCRDQVQEIKKEVNKSGYENYTNEVKTLERKYTDKLSKSHTLSTLREIDPYEFEEFVAKMWEEQGWNTGVTSGSTDRGVDVVATKEGTFEKRRHLIQVKRYGENSKVGSEDIQRYASLYQRDEQVDNVFVVTSNQFTSEAKEVAKRRDVSTVNGDELYEMLSKT
jgi:HJR/Mrr/RecB family endonuclease